MNYMFEKCSKIHRLSGIYLDRQLKSLGIRSGQLMYISLICGSDGLSQENIASELKVDKSSVARAVKLLEADGYVRRTVSMSDKRRYRVYATEKARSVYRKTTDITGSCEAHFTGGLTEIEGELLNSLLDKIVRKTV
ncbi:MAG: MarR family winged helix-turn-helix transcriptional regulator [Eubacteriales bacterium]|jgi:DNA-binding MarR family transcriptional regulator|nr:MarR family winged helix-turn-helix transcriptional regulator [Eubacteriales bacterium]